MKARRRLGWGLILLSALVGGWILVGGWLLDELDLTPMCGFRGDWTMPSTRTVPLNPDLHGGDVVEVAVTHEGNGGPATEVVVYRNGNIIGRFGGDVTTFVAFRNVDETPWREVLVASESRRVEEGLWRFDGHRFVKAKSGIKAKVILAAAETLVRAYLLAIVALMTFAVGLLLTKKGRPK